MKYYLAGPMTGMPNCYFPYFNEVADILRDRGYDVISPVDMESLDYQEAATADEDGTFCGLNWGEALSRDVKVVADEVDAVILLPGWRESRGARLEAYTAVLCGHQFFFWLEDVQDISQAYSNEIMAGINTAFREAA